MDMHWEKDTFVIETGLNNIKQKLAKIEKQQEFSWKITITCIKPQPVGTFYFTRILKCPIETEQPTESKAKNFVEDFFND